MNKEALDKLLSSGITREEAEYANISFLPNAYLLSPQFYPIKALKISYPDIDGTVTGFYRLRYLTNPPGFAGQVAKPQRYVQPKDTLNWVYLPHTPALNWEAISKDSSQPLIITEGELKALCGALRGYNVIALGGVYMWQSSKKGIALLPPLDRFNWKGRKVTIIFDSDAADNPQVSLAAIRLSKSLLSFGAIPDIASLPKAIDGSKQGLDDFLVAGGDLTEVLQSTRPLELGEHLAKFNNQYAYVLSQDVVVSLDSGRRAKRDSFVNGEHANTRVWEFVPTANGGMKKIDLHVPVEWLRWPVRRDAEGLVYEPAQPRITATGDFNAWKSWGCEAVQGSVAPWHKLMEFLFDGYPQDREWFEKWCAYPFQHPGAKMYTACVLWGPETGTGKSMVGLILGELYGDDNFTVVTHSDLFSSFNEWAVNKQFIMGDEISGTDKRADADMLKSLITRLKVRINMKHLPTYEVRDCTNYYFTSNHSDGVYLEDKDRRMFIHRVPNNAMPVQEYADIMDWIKNKGGKQALFHYLLNLPLDGFNPAAPAPLTESKYEMLDHGKSDLGEFIQGLLHNLDQHLVLLQQLEMLSEPPEIVLNKHLCKLYDPNGVTNVKPRSVSNALSSVGIKSTRIQETRVFGSQRFYILKNQDKWLKKTGVELKEYIDRVWTKSNVVPIKGSKY